MDKSAPPALFHRSSFCGDAHCVEAAVIADGQVLVRDSKDDSADALVLRFTADEWDAFLSGVEAGEFSREALAVHG